LPKASSSEVIKIIAAIGGSEVQHFEIWQDKAGNAPPVPAATGALFPQLPLAPDATTDGIDHSDPIDTNQVMARPCKFISASLPLCAVIRPTSTAKGGALAAVAGLTNSGLFSGQSVAFFKTLLGLAHEADEAGGDGRGFGDD
jgi:hypothetical protein